ncbi:DUF294 nucleotidyltransferase-like domain-containing protein [Halomonas halocynthiae]|uniref:DUF294 nucleotidyltransferase-like domain-containing protein n=1 Tax=Halomonas halocynthiae TaxID=176290 RepID=UPI0003FC6982|nr:DUF294 nucleotidyltransferase-like domain-containing protein [Halomonas halocynthiae]
MVEIDLSRVPFSLLDKQAQQKLCSNAVLVTYPAGAVLIEKGAPGEHVYIVQSGEIIELDPDRSGADAQIGRFCEGDTFGAISVFNGTSRYRFCATQDSRCYLLSAALFMSLCDASLDFANFFRLRLSEKARLITAHRNEGGVGMTGFMLAQVSDCMRDPLCLTSDASIAEAVRCLDKGHADSLLVTSDQGLGVVTKTDLLNALVLQGLSQQTPTEDVANYRLISVTPGQYLFEALVSMTRHQVSRVVVVSQDQAVGVVELTDVLDYFSSRSHAIALQVEQADNLEALAAASHRQESLVRALMSQGIKLRFAMGLLSAINGRIMSKAWNFVVGDAFDQSACLIVMGSEGRGEQILKTDQDNGLIIEDGLEWPALERTMQKLTQTLIALGYPSCPGNIMVSNPEWCGTESEWRKRIAHWAEARDGDSLMKLVILLDASGVAGNTALLDRLREWLFECCTRDQLLLSTLARPALGFATPLTFFGSLKKSRQGIDIKKGGIFPIVHGVRVMALESRVLATSTLERLDALVAAGRLDEHFAEDLGEALALFIELRLSQQLVSVNVEGEPVPTNLLKTQELSSLERDLLRESLHIVKELKQRLSHRFHLEYS